MAELRRNRVMAWWAELICRRPVAVLIFFSLLVAASIWLTAMRLQFQSDRNALISDELPWNKRFINWINHFGGTHDLIIVVDPDPRETGATPESHAQAQAFVREIARSIESRTDLVKRVVWGFDPTQVSPRAVRLLPFVEFERQADRLPQALPLLTSPTPQALIGRAVAALQSHGKDNTQPEAAARDIDSFVSLLDGFRQTLAAPDDVPLTRRMDGGLAPGESWEFLRSGNAALYFIRVSPLLDDHSLNAFAPSISLTRTLLTEMLPRYPLIRAGVTGIDVIEADETEAASFDSTYTTIIAAVLILLLMIAAFHGWRTPVLGMISLGCCISLAFGFVTLGVGHLQIISVVFALMLLGLGVDYGIYLASGHELVRHGHPDTREGFIASMVDVFQIMGPGVITGAITTAAAFATIIFTDFTGVAEMGLIASVGIVLCLLVMFTVFPALLALFKHRHSHVVPVKGRRVNFYMESWSMPFVRHPLFTLGVTAVIVIASLAAITRMQFDYNLFNLLPRGTESVEWQSIIDRKTGNSIYFGVCVVDNLDEARALTQALRTKPTVATVGGMGLLFPVDDEQKTARLQAIASANRLRERAEAVVASISNATPGASPEQSAPDLAFQVSMLQTMLGGAKLVEMPDEVRSALGRLEEAVNALLETLKGFTAEERADRLAALNAQYFAWRVDTATKIARVLDVSPLTPADLPAAAVEVYTAHDGRLSLEVAPRVPDDPALRDAGPLEHRFMKRFISDMRSVDPEVTGVIVQVYESGALIKRSYQIAGILALVIVFGLVWVDFRSIGDSLLCLLPVSVGFAVTFGVMDVAGMKINPANIIVLPLMFGIGVDAGVHMIHRWKQDPVRRPLGLTSGTGKGITVTSYATMIGFGCMVLARHRGIQSLGMVLTLGLGMTLLACWIVMPAAFELIQQRRDRAGAAK